VSRYVHKYVMNLFLNSPWKTKEGLSTLRCFCCLLTCLRSSASEDIEAFFPQLSLLNVRLEEALFYFASHLALSVLVSCTEPTHIFRDIKVLGLHNS